MLLRHMTPPDVIVLDLVMPAMSGWELLTVLRGDRALAQVPVVALSGSPDEEPVDGVISLAKPVDARSLLVAVDQACRWQGALTYAFPSYF